MPDIPATDIANAVSFDESASTYRIMLADGPRDQFILKGIQLSKAESGAVPTQSSTLTLSMLAHDQILIGVTEVEIKQNPESKCGYSVQTVFSHVGVPEIQFLALRLFNAIIARINAMPLKTSSDVTILVNDKLVLKARFAANAPMVMPATKS